MIEYIITALKSVIGAFMQGVYAAGAIIMSGLVAMANSMLPHIDTSSVASIYAQINIFYPLNETIAYATAYFLLWTIIFTYRFAKSLVPTVSS